MSEARFRRVVSSQELITELFSTLTTRNVAASPLVMGNSGEPFLQVLVPAGATNVQLPLETANAGKLLLIVNAAATAVALTFQSNAGAALSPAITAAQNKATLLFCDGVAWRALVSA